MSESHLSPLINLGGCFLLLYAVTSFSDEEYGKFAMVGRVIRIISFALVMVISALGVLLTLWDCVRDVNTSVEYEIPCHQDFHKGDQK